MMTVSGGGDWVCPYNPREVKHAQADTSTLLALILALALLGCRILILERALDRIGSSDRR
jgi:hypothetical protein